ncbi:hypothetical protein KFE96_00385 [Kordiimonas sp. SCSIO 12603]|uniref:sensor histidine kinase n=1 Tax=Kordiimonas sp. SCSIO 12603 TaxID=2829596 RepID=UPI0021065E41|nr:ATP-binding protein [Kordiimonas sp. SCSIO 12603]UTW58800.1 hypothetical protein KFE96_00385 [Kordiimonas sp. SCSIO 12603]
MMMNFKRYISQFRRRFWWRISIYAGLSCFVVISGAISLILVLNDYSDFLDTTEKDSLEMIAEEIVEEHSTAIQQSIESPVFENLIENTTAMLESLKMYQEPFLVPDTEDIDYFFTLNNVADVAYRITIYNAEEKELITMSSDKIPLNLKENTRFHVANVNVPMEAPHTGRVKVEIYATFNLWKTLSNNFGFADGPWIVFILLATFVGILSGFVSGWHMTKRLDRISAVTREWSAGHLGERIDDSHSDELGDHVRQLNRVADDLNELVLLRQELSAHNEREHLSKELHDTVKQQVFALALQIKALSKHPEMPDVLKARVEETEKTVSAINSEIVKLLSEARPSSQTSTNFIQGLVDLIPSYTKHISVVLYYDEEVLMMSQMQEHHLLRITQEALNNCVKHSKASDVVVRLKREDNIWSLAIRDNGVGFDTGNPKSGFGLNNMQERATSFYGDIIIESTPKKGTSVCITWKATVQTSKA